MLDHVKFLAGEELQGRGLGSEGLEKAAEYIAIEFQKAGLKPGGDENSFFQIWREQGGKDKKMMSLKNVMGVLPGKNQEWSDQSLVVCAHYDHLGLGWPDVREGNEGKIHFGADDNASGIAVMLELAKLLGGNFTPERTIVFIAFSGEESGLLGSRYYLKNAKKYPVKKIIGAINLDTVGRLGKNKILILSSSSASEWKHIARGIGFVTGIDYELVSQDLDASDQVSFIEAGVPAIQIFSGPNRDYHRPSDRVEKIDAAGMVKVASFTREAIAYLVEREEPMTFTGSGKTTIGRSLMKLIELNSGEIIFEGENIQNKHGNELKKYRKRVQIIFQDPYSSLNPKFTIGNIISEPLKAHGGLSLTEIIKRTKEMLDDVKLGSAYYNRYPHELSGGQRQRIGIARSLILNPEIVPVTLILLGANSYGR